MIRLVRVGRHEVAISNPDKIIFPERGLTTGDLVHYYIDVAEDVPPEGARKLVRGGAAKAPLEQTVTALPGGIQAAAVRSVGCFVEMV